MRRPALIIAGLAALTLSACSGIEVEEGAGAEAIAAGEVATVAGPEWTVTDIYLTPGDISALPPTVQGAVSFAFGGTSAVGATGCTRLQAEVAFHHGAELAAPEDADRVNFESVAVEEPGAGCTGDARMVHDIVVELVSPGSEFELARRGPTELVLTKLTPDIDSPSLRLVAL